MPVRIVSAMGALLPLLLLAPVAQGATVCVNSSASLQAALDTAQANNEADDIKVVSGTYAIDTSLDVGITDNQALRIEGGYAAGCSSPPVPTPESTVITGNNTNSLRIGTARGGLTIRNVTLSAFKPAAGTNAIVLYDSYADDVIHVENVAVTGNGVNGVNDSVLIVYASGGLVFDDNIVHDNANALAALQIYAQFPGQPVVLANNTIARNAGTGLLFNVYSMQQTALYNNIIWNNGAGDLIVQNVNGNAPPLAIDNTYLNCTGCNALSPASTGNSNADPSLSATLRLNAGSPAINSGIPAPLVLPLTDAANAQRVQGSTPDRGAYESSTNDLASTTYLVTSTDDDASNILTLRGAITAANAAGVPAAIRFHFSSGCPQVIIMNSPLPPIRVPMIIDGYSEPNSAMNTARGGPAGDIPFNAVICAIVFGTGGSPGPANAISVSSSASPSVHVDVRGLRFENFVSAIDFSGGYGHWVHGNAFAGPFLSSVIGNGVGVAIDGGYADVIGGPSTSDVNLIGASSGKAGVLVTGRSSNGLHTISNNAIGGDPGGSGTSYGNSGAGIDLLDASQVDVAGNWIVANKGDAVRIEGTQLARVQSNHVGSTVAPGLGNAGAGVHVLGGAGFNWVGTTDPTSIGRGNRVESNGGPGVWIDLDAGWYNQVTGNYIFDNGGIAIDLALLGRTPDAGTESLGPNHLLHKPTLLSAVYSSSGYINVNGIAQISQPNDSRYLNLYTSSACNGDAAEPFATYIVQADATGTIAINLIDVPQPFGNYISATLSSYSAGAVDTSEVSNSKRIAVSDDVYSDDFDCY